MELAVFRCVNTLRSFSGIFDSVDSFSSTTLHYTSNFGAHLFDTSHKKPSLAIQR